MRTARNGKTLCLILFGLLWWSAAAAAAEPLRFSVRLDAAVAPQPLSGRLYVFLSQRPGGEPRFGPDWFNPEPFFGLDVEKMQPGTSRRLDDRADGFPGPLSKLPPGAYRIQAMLDQDFFSTHHAFGVGNLYSDVKRAPLDPAASGTVELVLSRVVREEPFPASSGREEVVLRSQRLSAFHGRDVTERAMVVLPPSYHREPGRRYPVSYEIPGFGGSHRSRMEMLWIGGPAGADGGQVEFILVSLSGQCKWGHHVYANSETNGPRGDALVYEMIPYIDQHYRTVAAPTARFVSGHSSGGWASLWLQVSYPEVFGGVWSFAPDPVDFRDFQQIDLYARPPLNLYRGPQGERRPLVRRGTTPVLWFDSFARMDDCLGRGGQLRSFEAVFSPRGPDGLPRKLWDRATGTIDPQTALAWQKYDIRILLEKNWKTLGPKLQGKLHIVTGELDTFYLEGAVRLLAKTLRDLSSDAQVEIVPGRDHMSVLMPAQIQAARRQMTEAFLKRHPQPAGG
jgi:S-formylglutathione hydrolase FrmB